MRVDRGRGLLGRLALVAVVLATAGGGVWLLTATSAPAEGPIALPMLDPASRSSVDIPALQVQPAQVQPGAIAPASEVVDTVPQGATQGKDPLVVWADRVARTTGVPARALMAYGNAELVMRSTTPGCHLSWATLAGIGRIESNHGQFGGAVLGADGRPSKPIVGVPLDGSGGVQHIADSDHGAYDGDPTLDRAVGPMQFIPSTWAKWASDGNGDGRGDPQQIDDAALAAGRYLCVAGRDMGSASGWWAGILSYNNSVPYGQKVFGLADGYARDAQHA